MNSQPENKTEPKTEERKMIGVQFPLDKMTSTMIKDANLLVISIPLGVGPNSALGFLWRQLNELTAWFETLEIEAARNRKPGIIRAGANALKSLGGIVQ